MKIQTEVDEVLWRRARVAALQMGKTVGDFVELALVDFMDAIEGNLPLPTKTQMQQVKEEEKASTVTCFKCKSKVQKWTMDARGKPWCDDCLEDARNAIP